MTSTPRKLAAPLLAALLFASLRPAFAETPAPATEEEKTVYAVGLMLQRNLAQLQLTEAELQLVLRAITDAQAGKPAVKMEEYGPKVQALAQARTEKQAASEKEKGKAFLETAAKQAGAQKTASGLVYTETLAGTGASPAATDKVKVHYRGTLIDGTEFDSSIQPRPAGRVPVERRHRLLDRGLQKMKVGGKAQPGLPGRHRLRRPRPARASRPAPRWSSRSSCSRS